MHKPDGELMTINFVKSTTEGLTVEHTQVQAGPEPIIKSRTASAAAGKAGGQAPGSPEEEKEEVSQQLFSKNI